MRVDSWENLPTDKQDLYLTLLWEDKHTEQAIADFFSTTKGRIVRRRQSTLKLPSLGRSKNTIKRVVDPERFLDLLDLYAMEKLEEKGVTALTPPARDSEVQATPPPSSPLEEKCQWPLASSTLLKPVLCGKIAVPGHKLCEEHQQLTRRYVKR